MALVVCCPQRVRCFRLHFMCQYAWHCFRGSGRLKKEKGVAGKALLTFSYKKTQTFVRGTCVVLAPSIPFKQ